MQLEQLLDVLHYTQSSNYYSTNAHRNPLTEHIYRAAKKAGVQGTYVIHTSPSSNNILPVRPVVYVASAQTVEAARAIHYKVWNLGTVPFLLILLPNHIRVYTGFAYSQHNENDGLIDLVDLNLTDIRSKLGYIFALPIDSGTTWKSQAKHLVPEKRVNIHLLNNLKKLAEYLLNQGLHFSVAHSLIGKYLYICCLRDREILSSNWLTENDINLQSVLSSNATVSGLDKFIKVLEKRFSRDIFPFPLQGCDAITDEIVSLVASVFNKDERVVNQLHLDFTAYDFSYIPAEILSSIYEQLLNLQPNVLQEKTVYTPEVLADYLLYEINQSRPLFTGMKILDPCCSCGTFLVLAYRRLIEMELVHSSNGKVSFGRLNDILIESIYGFEQNCDAFYVAEFSLLLTMLDYIEPKELHNHQDFKFPLLHNHQIFESNLSQTKQKFNWIVGNFYIINLKSSTSNENLLNSITELLQPDGYAGLIIHTESLLNHEFKEYRRQFFHKNEVARITNFTNLADILFHESLAPVSTIVYTKAKAEREKPEIIHFAPSVINQIHNLAWMITINANEIQLVSPDEAETGEAIVWKLALWGSYRDKRTIKRLNRVFNTNLGALAEQKNWRLNREGVFRITAHKCFTIPEPLFTISRSEEDTSYVHAISICFNSYISEYYHFFQSRQWNVVNNSIFIGEIQNISVPALSVNQVVEISRLQEIPEALEISTEAQEILDKEIEKILNIPRNISIIAKDFINVRCKLNKTKVITATQPPTEHNLVEYGECLARELDEFVQGSGIRHKISIVNSDSFTICTVEITKSSNPIDITVTTVTGHNNYYSLLKNIQQESRYKFNQWLYTQCGIYILDGAKIHICKASRLIDWTQTQALNDSDDIIAQLLTTKSKNNEVLLEGVG